MTFEKTRADIRGPLSTSIDEMVAIQFANTNGLIIELIPNTRKVLKNGIPEPEFSTQSLSVFKSEKFNSTNSFAIIFINFVLKIIDQF